MAQSRSWCYTLNNPSATEVQSLKDLSANVSYHIFQLERGQSGTLHAQGFIQFARKLRLRTAKSLINQRCHCEVLRGTPQEASNYCRKEDGRVEGPFETGTITSQGKRNDLVEFAAAIKAGSSDRDLIEGHLENYFKYQRVISHVRAAYTEQRNWQMDVRCYWGASGSGKTRRSVEEAGESVFFLSKGDAQQTTWWDRYNGQFSVILDDFYGWLPWSTMLRLLDRYPYDVQFKGGSIPFTSRRIFITSNQHPRNWYKHVPNHDLTPLLRRINTIEEMN